MNCPGRDGDGGCNEDGTDDDESDPADYRYKERTGLDVYTYECLRGIVIRGNTSFSGCSEQEGASLDFNTTIEDHDIKGSSKIEVSMTA